MLLDFGFVRSGFLLNYDSINSASASTEGIQVQHPVLLPGGHVASEVIKAEF